MDCNWTFLSADVELTNHCAENCAMCPRERLQRPRGFMSREVFSRVLEVLVRFGSRVTFSGFGNPTLHPFWAECVSRTRNAGLPAGLVLHPSALSPETMSLLAGHPPSHLEISMPSVDPALFSRLCPQTDFADAVQRIVRLHHENIAQMVCVGLETPGTPQAAKRYRNFWKVHGIRSRFFPCHSRGGNLRDSSLITASPTGSASCGLIAMHAFIAWSGELLACCHDLTGETRLGNLCSEDPLILAGRKAQFAAAPPWQLCRTCDEFRKGWPLPAGDCPSDPALRAGQLRLTTRNR